MELGPRHFGMPRRPLSAGNPNAKKNSKGRIALSWSLAFVAGIGVGRWMGGGEPSPPSVRATGLSGPPIAQESPNPGGSESPNTLRPNTLRVPAPSGAPQAAPAVPDRPGFAGDPAAALGAVIDSLRDDEIIAALSTATHMDPEELRDVRDLRALAQRMSEVALEGLVGGAETPASDLDTVYFSEEALSGDPPSGDRAPAKPRTFSGKEPILATFSTAEYPDERVFMKWTRLDDPELVLFRPYPVTPGARSSEVWLRPESNLRPGRYKVTFYSGDETMRPLASGLYSVPSPDKIGN
ncbi:MAG TPA: hypothetical protein EYQ66_06680 [Myxococcales bacterium]|nr:hypothetical protein [Myxococcales bacterium]